jgi:hypothetical protein
MMFLQMPNTQIVQNNLKMTYLLEEKFFTSVYSEIVDNSDMIFFNTTEASRESLIFVIDMIKAIRKVGSVLNTNESMNLGSYFNNTPVKDLFTNWSIRQFGDTSIDLAFESIAFSYYYITGFFLGLLLLLFAVRISLAK